jgi:hypothetical protein
VYENSWTARIWDTCLRGETGRGGEDLECVAGEQDHAHEYKGALKPLLVPQHL